MNIHLSHTEGGTVRAPGRTESSHGPRSAAPRRRSASTLEFPPRATIYEDRQSADLAFEILAGGVILWSALPDGRRQIVQFVHPGEVFGLSSGGTYEETAVTFGRTVVTPIPLGPALIPSHRAELLDHARRRIAALQAHALLLGRMTAMERVASFLVALLPRACGEEPPEQPCRIDLAISRIEIADYLGLTVETVSRNLTRLRQRGIIATGRPEQIEVRDPAALRKAAAIRDEDTKEAEPAMP